MLTLRQLVPDPEVLLAIEPEELGWPLLQIARTKRNNTGLFLPWDYVSSGSDVTEYEP